MKAVARGLLVASCGAAFAVAATAASAQTATFANWQDSPGLALRPLGGPIPEWSLTVGGGVAALPVYEGSNVLKLSPVPDVDVRYKDLAYLSVGEGVGVNILHGTNYRAGLGLTYDAGREHSAATRLAGTKNIDPAPVAKAFAQYAFIPVVLDFDVKQALTSYQGLSADLGAYLPVVASKKLQVFVGPEVTFANHQYMQAYFGIDPQNRSSQSHFRNYGAGGGIKDAKLGGTAMYHFDDHWFVDTDVGLERLLGSAAGSPIVQTRWNLSIDGTINYTF